jgi:hypothetical protein
MFCTSLSPELLGPLPPFPGDRALPNMGYSFMLMYVGEQADTGSRSTWRMDTSFRLACL